MISQEERGIVISMVIELFAEQPVDLARLLWFFENVTARAESAIRVLLQVRHIPRAFMEYASRVAEDTRTAEYNQQFCADMMHMYQEMLTFAGEYFSPSVDMDALLIGVARRLGPTQALAAVSGMTTSWALIPMDVQIKVLDAVASYAPLGVTLMAQSTLVAATRFGAGRSVAFLAFVQLSYTAIMSIRAWWRGEISGRRCAKCVFDSTLPVIGGVAGGFLGATAGGYLGAMIGTGVAPGVGTLVGGVVGSVGGSKLGELTVEYLSCWLFDLPQTVALEKAYAHLGIRHTATNDQVNLAYWNKCRETHPDLGGSPAAYHMTQIQMELIKISRGQ